MPVQPTLDGTTPEPALDYDTWETTVWPTFVDVARSGRPFVCWKIAQAHDLPQPPCPERDWARLMRHLRQAQVVSRYGFGFARDMSACRKWRGTRAAQAGRAA